MLMNIPQATSQRHTKISISIIVLTAIVLLLSVNDWSLWLDEAITAEMFSVGSFSDLVNQFDIYDGSEVQMPGWIMFMWGWCKLFGNGEYAMRSANFLFMGIWLLYVSYILSQRNLQDKYRAVLWIALLLTALSPFVLYNMNEARCNIPMFAISFICVLSLWRYAETGSRFDFLVFISSFVVGYVFNMLFGFLLVGILCFSIAMKRHGQLADGFKANKIISAIAVVLFAVISCYYLSTVLGESKGGQIERPGIGNLGYVFFEFMGFSGLGPSKNILRESADKVSLLVGYAPGIVPLAACYLLLFAGSFRRVLKDDVAKRFMLAFACCFVAFFIAAFVIKFRFWGRHLLSLYPFWILIASFSVYYFVQSKKSATRLLFCALLFALLALSSFRIVFNDSYKKEDVKGLVELCKEIRNPGEKIYWSESDFTARYYNLTDSLVVFYSPAEGEHGMYVWFNRVSWKKPGELERFLGGHRARKIYENRDFSVYRF